MSNYHREADRSRWLSSIHNTRLGIVDWSLHIYGVMDDHMPTLLEDVLFKFESADFLIAEDLIKVLTRNGLRRIDSWTTLKSECQVWRSDIDEQPAPAIVRANLKKYGFTTTNEMVWHSNIVAIAKLLD